MTLWVSQGPGIRPFHTTTSSQLITINSIWFKPRFDSKKEFLHLTVSFLRARVTSYFSSSFSQSLYKEQSRRHSRGVINAQWMNNRLQIIEKSMKRGQMPSRSLTWCVRNGSTDCDWTLRQPERQRNGAPESSNIHPRQPSPCCS